MSGAAATLSLHPDHLADLHKSGLSDDMIRAAGLYSVRPCDLSRLIGFAPQGVTSALAFPYLGDGGFIRVKVFPSYRDKGGHTVKYLQRKEAGARLYVPPGCEAVLREASIPLAVTEGEKKALKLTQEGTLTLGIGGLWNWIKEGEPIPDLDKVIWNGRRVILYPDSDVWGRPDLLHAVYALAKELEARGATVLIAVISHGENENKIGIDDYLQAGGTLASLETIPLTDPCFASAVRWWEGWRATGGAEREKPDAAVIICLADVEPEKVTWLWHGRIPIGKVTLLDGDPGLGKSMLAFDLASRVSTGSVMPDGSPSLPGGAVILTIEDGLADTVVPRLKVAGADRKKIVALQGVKSADGKLRVPTVEDVVVLTSACKQVAAKIVIIDPLMAYLPSHRNSWRDQDVRQALAPLAKMAEEIGVAVLVIRHLNKSGGSQSIYRGGGSIGIAGAARSALLVAKDPEDENRRVLAAIKTNLGAFPPSLTFHIEEADDTARIVWEGISSHTADALLAAPVSQEERSALEEAVEFLQTILAKGPVEVTQIQKAARKAGLANATLRRAKSYAGVTSNRDKFGEGGKWFWRLDAQETSKVLIQNSEHLRGDMSILGDFEEV